MTRIPFGAEVWQSRTLSRYAADPSDVRSLAEVELILASRSDVDPRELVGAVLKRKLEQTRVSGSLASLELLAHLIDDARRGHGLTRVFSAVSRNDKEFRRIWKGLRVPCPLCARGWLRILRRRWPSGRVYRFAACSYYHVTGCAFTESSHAYVARKGAAVVCRLDALWESA